MRRKCRSLRMIEWSRHSRLTLPIRRSTYGFCHGLRGAVTTSSTPIAVTVERNDCPYAPSRSRIRYRGDSRASLPSSHPESPEASVDVEAEFHWARPVAPRNHGELLKLGIDVSQATVTRYMVRHSKPPSQTWRTFLDNHVGESDPTSLDTELA